jgi:hypothetical protein
MVRFEKDSVGGSDAEKGEQEMCFGCGGKPTPNLPVCLTNSLLSLGFSIMRSRSPEKAIWGREGLGVSNKENRGKSGKRGNRAKRQAMMISDPFCKFEGSCFPDYQCLEGQSIFEK